MQYIRREYASFFSPMERRYYKDDVTFIDPLLKIQGVDKYQSNVDMLAGRSGIGAFLFKDASINLHEVVKLPDNKLMTRWTLRVTVKALPWSPTARFTGVSIYTLANDGKISKQEDYWDSINLKKGEYSQVSLLEGLSDFISQLQQDSGAEMAAPELPYELLRRSNRYEVRRYPAFIAAQTTYEQRPEGYDRLNSYCRGSNENMKNIDYYSPTVMTISDENDGSRSKSMLWPIKFVLPGETLTLDGVSEPTIPKVSIVNKPSFVVAVARFQVAASEPVVRGFTAQLLRDISADKLVAVPGSSADSNCTVCQYDALFSLNKRRNEVWVELADHPWTSG